MTEQELPVIGVDAQWLAVRNFMASGKSQDKFKLISSVLSSALKLIREDGYRSEIKMLFDYGSWRYRPKEQNPEYKANREYDPSWEVLYECMNLLQSTILPAIGIKSYRIPGLEADDLGYLVANSGRPCMLHSSDRDWYISINPNTVVLNPNDGLVSGRWLETEYGLETYTDFLAYKAIIGDGSDNIPGVPATGTPLETLAAFKSGSGLEDSIRFRIRANMELMRLDRIIHDKEVLDIYSEQDKNIHFCQQILKTLESHVEGNFPTYFHGVLGKYNRNVTSLLVEK